MAILIVASLWLKNPIRKRQCLTALLVVFLVFTNPFLSHWLVTWYEPFPKPISSLKTYEVGVVLSGVANLELQPADRVYYSQGADRVLHAAQLYKMGKVKKILITGGSGRLFTGAGSEAATLKKTLLLHEIPESAIVLETASFNTHENAVFSKRLLDSMSVKECLLITSAFHMPRAEACFRKTGILLETFPVDFHHHPILWTPDSWLLPSEKSFFLWHILIKEWIGRTIYALMGYT